MGTFQIVRETDWLEPASSDVPMLLHCDRDDIIQVCPARLGQGYVQKIPLREDLSLVIIDYTLDQPLLVDAPGDSGLLEFEFQLAGPDPGQSFFVPYFGLRGVGARPAKRRIFKVEVFFKPPTLNAYFQDFTQRLSAPVQRVIESILRQLCRQAGASHLSLTSSLERLMTTPLIFEQTYEQLLSSPLYSDAAILGSATRRPITPAMETIIGQILHCPYQGTTRRAYLERKAIELVALRLEGLSQSPASPLIQPEDICRIHKAETILRHHLRQPPSIETLARQVALNRLKLNQGFHCVFGTTPYGHLRHCRLHQARRLLMTTDFSIEQVAEQVGYTSRSRFASAFRQEYGLNPKMFQMQSWQLAG